MNEQYRTVYRDLQGEHAAASRRPAVAGGRRAPMTAWEFAQTAWRRSRDRLGDANPSLREDAEYFLLLNLEQLVLRPVMHPDAPDGAPPPKKLADLISADAEALVKRASTYSAKRDGSDEITGGDLIKALGDEWDQLQLNSFKIWE